jgi:hypothetical protein
MATTATRTILSCMIIGGGLLPLFMGLQLKFRASGASPVPVKVDLAQLEAGWRPADRHLQIGPHVALFQATSFWVSASADLSNPDTVLDWAYYPICSEKHPAAAFAGRPPSEIPSLKGVCVLVETQRFKTLGAIPQQGFPVSGLRGMIGRLAPDHRRHLEKHLPGIDPDRILVVEENATPPPVQNVQAFLSFGGVCVALGLFVLLFRLPSRTAAPVAIEGTTVALGVGRLVLAGLWGLFAAACLMMCWKDWCLFQSSTAEAIPVDLRLVERGVGSPGSHIHVGRHLALLQASVPLSLGRAWYPMLSEAHPAMPRLREIGQAYGGVENIPREKLPPLETIGMMAMTKQYPTAQDIPKRGEWREAAEGVAFGSMGERTDLRKPLSTAYPKVKLHQIVDFRPGRKPTQWWEPIASALLGMLFAGLAIRSLIGRTKEAPAL